MEENMARAVYDFQSLNKKTAIGKMREAMSKEITQFDDAMFETRLDALVKTRVEQIANAGRYEHKTSRKAFCAGHYERGLTAKVGKLELKVPKLKGAVFESAVIERYRRREQSVEESLIDMYLAGVSTRRVDDTGRLLWDDRIPSQTLNDKLGKVYAEIDAWRERPLEGEWPYVFVDGVWHKRSWGGQWRTSACSSPSASTPTGTAG